MCTCVEGWGRWGRPSFLLCTASRVSRAKSLALLSPESLTWAASPCLLVSLRTSPNSHACSSYCGYLTKLSGLKQQEHLFCSCVCCLGGWGWG